MLLSIVGLVIANLLMLSKPLIDLLEVKFANYFLRLKDNYLCCVIQKNTQI